jgi:hypothetical protein
MVCGVVLGEGRMGGVHVGLADGIELGGLDHVAGARGGRFLEEGDS